MTAAALPTSSCFTLAASPGVRRDDRSGAPIDHARLRHHLRTEIGQLFGHLAAVRNFAGFLGLALLTGRLIAGRLGWLVPAAWAFTALTLGDPTGTGLTWDWPVHYDNDLPALGIALTFAVLGLMAAATGTREPRDEQRD